MSQITTTVPAELTTLPWGVLPLQRADRADRGPEYVTGYLTAPDDAPASWLDAQLAGMRAALRGTRWGASWLGTDAGDTRIVVRPRRIGDDSLVESPRSSPTAYAVVLPPPDGRPILLRPNLTRLAYGLWPDGFRGQVVGVIVDAGTGDTEAGIRAALTVTVLDPVFRDAVRGVATDHVWCEMDRLRADEIAAPPT